MQAIQNEGETTMTGMQEYIDQLEGKTDKDALEKVAFQVRLEAVDAFQLNKLAEKFDRKKSTFAADILRIAIQDAWQTAGMENIEDSAA